MMVQHCVPGSDIVLVETAAEAKKLLTDQTFDLLILDLELEDRSGLDLLEECKHLEKRPSILVVSGHTRNDYVSRVLRAGAFGYVSKAAPKSELVEAISTVLEGKFFLSQDIARSVAESTVFKRNQPPHTILSGREHEIFLLLARGLQPKEIAARMNLSVRTVAVHKFKAFKKVGLRNLVELYRYCQEHDLLMYETTTEAAQ
jgi:DNA-binding NarL/FixJ family response regulator